MKAETKKTLKRLGIGGLITAGIVTIAKLIHKARAEEEWPEPPEPPPEGTGRVQGYVIDAVTEGAVPQAQIYVDGNPNTTADTTGGFRTSYIDYGPHILSIYGDGYETGIFEIMLEQSLLQDVFYLEPLEEIPGFPDDIEVTGIRISPPYPRLGETVAIGVYLLVPYPTPIPDTISGTITVDGDQLTETIYTRGVRNPAKWFQYTPPAPGTYRVAAKNKSATFEVLADIVGTFYCPFGCVAPTEDGAWGSKWGLLGSWITLDEPRWYPDYPAGRDCMVKPRFFGGGTGATGYEGTVYCPLCHEAMRTGRRPGDHSYMWALAEMLFDHIERAHPEVQWNRPNAWIRLELRDVFRYKLTIDGYEYSRYSSGWLAKGIVVSPGVHSIGIDGLIWVGFKQYEPFQAEYQVNIEDYGDRATLNGVTGEITTQKWEDLL